MLRPVPPAPAPVETLQTKSSGDPAHDDTMGLITDFVAGRLAPEERARVSDHLKACAICRETNPIRDEDLIRRAMALAYPAPTERQRLETAKRIFNRTGVRVGPLDTTGTT